MPRNYPMLAKKIKEVFGSQKAFSRGVGLSERSVSLKMNGKVDWKQREIVKACEVLHLELNEVGKYFF